jgi:hypothetical protein
MVVRPAAPEGVGFGAGGTGRLKRAGDTRSRATLPSGQGLVLDSFAANPEKLKAVLARSSGARFATIFLDSKPTCGGC